MAAFHLFSNEELNLSFLLRFSLTILFKVETTPLTHSSTPILFLLINFYLTLVSLLICVLYLLIVYLLPSEHKLHQGRDFHVLFTVASPVLRVVPDI